MKIPSLKLHKGTGQSYIWWKGKAVYFGKHGEPATDKAYWRWRESLGVEAAGGRTEPIRWGYECKTVRWHGQTFHFTDGQAEVVRLLKYYFDRGIRRVREASLTMALRIDTSETDYRLIDRFKAGKKYHPAIDTMIFVESAWWSIGR